jgi:hypothetical protein
MAAHSVSEHKKTGRFLEAHPIEVEDGKFKAQAVTKLGERFKSMKNEPQIGIVSEELKQAIGEADTRIFSPHAVAGVCVTNRSLLVSIQASNSSGLTFILPMRTHSVI